jgi:serine-type D-Ala-D-Ala carboxypeptidase/endopeptidase (penicillin-binding protein 4)
MKRKRCSLALAMAIGLLISSGAAYAVDWRQAVIAKAGQSAIYVEDSAGQPVITHRIAAPMVPASILKVATSYCALKVLPKRFRFTTAFHVDKADRLYVTGYGDPSLTSEELAIVAQGLRSKGLTRVTGIVLNDSFFDQGLVIDGQSHSLNPYDAHNSALLVNYNTINVQKLRNGTVVSAEPQTPLTAMTAALAKPLRAGTQRINLARTPDKALVYVGHLLKAFLVQAGVAVSGPIARGVLPRGVRTLYIHHSSKGLHDNIRDLLEFSNNLVTNQIFLVMGAVVLEAPATVAKGRAVLNSCLRKELGWTAFHAEEGAGLSRKNRVTAREMMVLVRNFAPYANLMPRKERVFRAKTGSLNGVSSFVGYFTTPQGKDYRFVVIINDPQTTYHAKFTVAKMIYQGLSQ